MKFKINLTKITKFVATMGALFTMVMSPVAMGREAQKITVKQLQMALDEAGLNRQITVGDFYNKNKHLIPERLRKEFESFVAAYKNQLMPQFEVVGAKATDGTEVATLRLTQGDEIITIQMLGEEEKYAKIQNTYLSEIDVINFSDMFKRLLSADEKFRKQYESATNAATPKKGAYTGFPDLTVAAWKGMSQKERAGYMINMRLLWNDARRVLIEAERKDKKGRKTSSIEPSAIEKWDNFFALLTPSVEAARSASVSKVPSAQKPGGASTAVKQGKASSAFVSGSNCLVAGYVSKYSATRCGIDGIYDSYKRADGSTDELVQSANQFCSNVGIACNPYVYGTPGGTPICVNPKETNFQVATHYDGPCDSASRLGSAIPFLKDENIKSAKRYDPKNMDLTPEELEAKYKQEQEAKPQMVEDYLNGLMAYNPKDPTKKNAGIKFTDPLTEDVLKSILKIKENFDNDIKKARESCRIAAAKNKNNEKNFWGACDQLHRRFLNVAQFLQKTPGCKDGGTVSEGSLKCSCPNGGEALPGTSCGSAQPPPSCPVAPVGPPPQDCVPGEAKPPSGGQTAGPECAEKYPGATGLDALCRCPGGTSFPEEVASSADDTVKQFKCVDKPSGKPAEEKDCGLLCKAGNFLKKYGLLIAGGAATILILRNIFTPKKPKRSSPADLCPNGTTAPCPQSCSNSYHVMVNGVCDCAPCMGGQVMLNSAICQCGTATTTTTYTCPDGVTKVTDLNTCPTTITCWDGSKVPYQVNCPEQPSSTRPSSGPGKVKK